MIRRPPRSTLDRSSAASDVYKRQVEQLAHAIFTDLRRMAADHMADMVLRHFVISQIPVSYTHLRAHETVLDIVYRLLLEKKKHLTHQYYVYDHIPTHKPYKL